jgi:hypothetical protein
MPSVVSVRSRDPGFLGAVPVSLSTFQSLRVGSQGPSGGTTNKLTKFLRALSAALNHLENSYPSHRPPRLRRNFSTFSRCEMRESRASWKRARKEDGAGGRTERPSSESHEGNVMDTTLVSNSKLSVDSEAFRQTAMRLTRAGLVIDQATLSPSHRRAFFALQCRHAVNDVAPESQRTMIGFPVPSAR